jgi:uncharacterized protein YbjT (DUF2867 family)
MMGLQAVTGAFGFSGKYIAQRLLDAGRRVITLTNSPERNNPFGGRVPAFRYNFKHPARLAASLEGVDVLYNTYWVRFNHQRFTFAGAIENSRVLLKAAEKAKVERIVHISITNPSEESPLEYFRGKAMVERAVKESGISYCIMRPAVLFGKEDILINNIAWLLRRFPIFGVFGDGDYKLQPIYVDDLAALAVEQGKMTENSTIEAIGPETFTYRGLIEALGKIIGKPRPIISVPPLLGFMAGRIIGRLVGDVFVSREEIEGLMAGLLYVNAPPAGRTKLSDWAARNADMLGKKYAGELPRRIDRKTAYKDL